MLHAGKYAAEQHNANVVDPKPHFVGSLKDTLQKYPHIGSTIPAMGYSPEQVQTHDRSADVHTSTPVTLV